MRVGSLFSGIGGLELALEAAGHRTVWTAEKDKWASRVLAERFPGIPNHGDLTVVDWTTVEPIDILAGGFPCQDISHAGKREGIHGERSGLWREYVRAIITFSPRWVFIENVAALRSRGLDVVLADLSALGFHAEWSTLRASDLGCPHRRDRLFLVSADASRERLTRRGSLGPNGWTEPPDSGRRTPGRGETPPDSERGGLRVEPGRSGGQGWPRPLWVGQSGETPPEDRRTRRARTNVDPGQATLWSETPPDSGDSTNDGERSRPEPLQGTSERLLPTPTVTQGRNATATRDGSRGGSRPYAEGNTLQDIAYAAAFGDYAPAIARWAAVTRPPPPPMVDGRLSAAFVEWMMGLPDGWTDIKIPKTQRLKMLGNAVVPQQGLAAWIGLGGPIDVTEFKTRKDGNHE